MLPEINDTEIPFYAPFSAFIYGLPPEQLHGPLSNVKGIVDRNFTATGQCTGLTFDTRANLVHFIDQFSDTEAELIRHSEHPDFKGISLQPPAEPDAAPTVVQNDYTKAFAEPPVAVVGPKYPQVRPHRSAERPSSGSASTRSPSSDKRHRSAHPNHHPPQQQQFSHPPFPHQHQHPHFDNSLVKWPKPCLFCSNAGDLVCSRCRAPYCSQACQRTDWSHHARHCAPMPLLVPALHFNMRQQQESFMQHPFNGPPPQHWAEQPPAPNFATNVNGHARRSSSVQSNRSDKGITPPVSNKPTPVVNAPKKQHAKPAKAQTLTAAGNNGTTAAATNGNNGKEAKVNPFKKKPSHEIRVCKTTGDSSTDKVIETLLYANPVPPTVEEIPPVQSVASSALASLTAEEVAAKKAAMLAESARRLEQSIAEAAAAASAAGKQSQCAAAVPAAAAATAEFSSAASTPKKASTAAAVLTATAGPKPMGATTSAATSAVSSAASTPKHVSAPPTTKPTVVSAPRNDTAAKKATTQAEATQRLELLLAKAAAAKKSTASAVPLAAAKRVTVSAAPVDPKPSAAEPPIDAKTAAASAALADILGKLRSSKPLTPMLQDKIDMPYVGGPASGSPVMITEIVQNDACFVVAADTRSQALYADINEAVDRYSRTARPLTERPVVRQVVLAPHPRLLFLRRALVLRNSEPMLVAFTDYGQTATVPVAECRELAAELQQLLRCVHRVVVEDELAGEQLLWLRGKRLRMTYDGEFGELPVKLEPIDAAAPISG